MSGETVDGPHDILIGKIETVHVLRQESNFDRACDLAYRIALDKFGIDEFGHSQRITEWERSSCWIELNFESYVRVGEGHLYIFKASAKKHVEED